MTPRPYTQYTPRLGPTSQPAWHPAQIYALFSSFCLICDGARTRRSAVAAFRGLGKLCVVEKREGRERVALGYGEEKKENNRLEPAAMKPSPVSRGSHGRLHILLPASPTWHAQGWLAGWLYSAAGRKEGRRARLSMHVMCRTYVYRPSSDWPCHHSTTTTTTPPLHHPSVQRHPLTPSWPFCAQQVALV